MLESLINPEGAERTPWKLFFLGIIFSTVAILVSMFIFKRESGMVAVVLTVFAAIPIFYDTIKYEEKKDTKNNSEKKLLEEHGKAIKVFMYLFLGFLVSFTVWYAIIPEAGTTLFQTQTETITSRAMPLTGQAIGTFESGLNILLNNSIILAICLLLSLLYGAGALFVLTWNASIGGVFIGSIIKQEIANATSNPTTMTYVQATSIGLIKYLPHGLLEMAAYFVVALAGGILSSAIIRKEYKTRKFSNILFDTSYLVIISVSLLIIAAIVETTVSAPLF